ncbi:MAG TPA: LCP family protein [Bacillota bacterium]|nr:LCP family protein [Bacillota bacterium]
MKRREQAKTADKRTDRPATLLDLNRSLPNYTYHPGGSPAIKRVIEQPKRRFRWKTFWKWTGITTGVACLVIGGYLGWKILHNELKVFGWKGIVSLVQNVKLKGEDTGHVTVLLAGNSADDPGHSGGNLTDSIMLLSLNTRTHTAFMISVPRDLYVTVPNTDGDAGKINEVYQDGEQMHFSEAGYAPGGMGLLEKTISQNFGITINYYGLVNYSAVRQAVDAVGGIEVNIQSNDPRGVYDPSPDLSNNYKPLVNLSNGVHTINGVQALGLSRARGDSYGAYGYALSDFTRTQYQRQVLLALKDKAFSAGILANPVKLGNLFDSLGSNVKTDMTLGEVKRLYSLTKDMNDNKITSAGLNDADGKNLLSNYTTRYGQSALIPRLGVDDYSEIQAYIQKLANPVTSTNTNSGATNQ